VAVPLGPAFTRFWLSEFVANFGDGIRLAAFPLLAAGLTHSPAVVGAVVAAQGVPWLIVGLGAGVVIDRHDLRTVMVGAAVLQVMMVGTLAVAVLARFDSLPLVFAAAVVTGLGATVRFTASQTATPRLVGPEELDRANGRLVAGEIVGSELLGPASAGVLFGVAAALPFALNAGGIGMAALLLLTLPSVFQPVRRPAPDPAAARSAAGDFIQGLRWLVRDRVMRDLVLTVSVVALVDASWFAILVLYVTRTLHQSAAGYGALLAVSAVGGIAVSVCYGRLTRRLSLRSVLVGPVVIMAATQLVLGVTRSLALTAFMLACSSGAFAGFNVVAVGLRQRRVPPAFLGRVTSVSLAIAGAAAALGALAGGVLATTHGIQAPMLVGVVPLLAVALFLRVRFATPQLDSPQLD
jgi:predicted MFS family arabinose efflux permease